MLQSSTRSSLFALVSLLLCASPAAQDHLFTVSPLDANLRTIDPATATTLTTVPITASTTILGANGLARHPITGELWALLKLVRRGSRHLARLDPATGTATLIGDTGLRFANLAFDSGGRLFGITGDGESQSPETLYTIDLATASPTLRFALGNGSDGEAIAYDPVTGLLLHASGLGVPNVHEILETVDPQSGTVTSVPLSGTDTDEILSITQWVGRNFLAADRFDDLHVVSAAGVVSKIGRLDHSAKGLVFVPAGDEPFFRTYGDGCAANGGYIPVLAGSGTPQIGNTVTLRIVNGPGGVPGAIAVGVGRQSLVLSPGCTLHNLPLLPFVIPVTLSGTGSGTGTAMVPLTIPPGSNAFDLYFQAGVLENGALSLTNPLQIHVQ